jgi:hypothetical protein
MKTERMTQYDAIRMFILSVIILSGLFHASLAAAEEFYLYGVVESFTWREFDAGERAVMESGPLFGLGFAYSHEFEDHITITPEGEIYFGNVDYDGHACSIDPITLIQTCQPSTSTVDYVGLKLDGDIGYRFRLKHNSFIEPFGGLELWAWRRDIKNGTAADGSATAGYIEDWATLNFRLGVRGGIDLSKSSKMFADAGVKLPLYNVNTAYVSDIGLGPDVTIHPGKQASFFAETGIILNRVKASVFYDSLRFSESSPVSNGYSINGFPVYFHQPQSTIDLYGIKLGVLF